MPKVVDEPPTNVGFETDPTSVALLRAAGDTTEAVPDGPEPAATAISTSGLIAQVRSKLLRLVPGG